MFRVATDYTSNNLKLSTYLQFLNGSSRRGRDSVKDVGISTRYAIRVRKAVEVDGHAG